MNIYLCGMIGSGKTTLGKRLAQELGMDFGDLDQEMDRILGYSFHRLVEEKGWVAFRELEYAICKGFARMNDTIFALGGGTVRYQWNMDVLRGTGPIILLEASLETLIQRVSQADRPRVNLGTTLEQDVRAIWSEHKEKYYAAADLIYPADRREIEEEVAEIKTWILGRMGGR